uniref:Uncharacterized protein n=1 Tax=Micrurus paraensis TaxID=1970185 RepID=A0A2D4K8P0_9SAUR
MSKNIYLLTPLQLYAKMLAKLWREGKGGKTATGRGIRKPNGNDRFLLNAATTYQKMKPKIQKYTKTNPFLPIKCKTGGLCLSLPLPMKSKGRFFPLTGAENPY